MAQSTAERTALREDFVSSDRMRRHDVGDPCTAHWYIDTLARGATQAVPLDPALAYVANLLRRHLAHRMRALDGELAACEPRFESALRAIRDRVTYVAFLIDLVEREVGDLVIACSEPRRRELPRLLTLVREQLLNLRQLELDAAMRQDWEDLGASG